MDEDAKGPEDQAADKQPEPIEARQGPAADKQPESIEAQQDQAADKQPEPIEARQGPAADKQPESIEAQQDQAADKKPETIEAQQADKQPESIEAQQDQAADKQPESIEAQQGPAADKQPEPIELQGSNAHLQKQQQQQQPPQEPQQPQPEPATSSSAPKNEYLAFREMLKHESALPLLSRLQDFVRQFPEGSLSRDQAADRIHKFLSATQEWMLSKVVVFAAEADEAEQVSASEGLEKFLMMRLHGKIFGLEKTDPEEDELLKRRIDSLSWVGFHNLGVPSVDVSLLDLAVSQLQSMDKFKAPRDKMICILNACRVINDVLKRAIVESGGGRPLAADDFLPLLIYCVILANPPRLHSNIEFVAAFRHPSRLVAEDAYFLTALQSAVAFVRDAGPKVLDVSEEEFKELCAASTAAKGYSNGSKREPTTALEKGLELGTDVKKLLVERIATLPFRFEGTQARHLRVGDLPQLLEEYREMAQILKKIQTNTLTDDG